MSQPIQSSYTTAQVHHRLGVPKPTIRNWSAEYADFLSERARPAEGKTRSFSYEDLVVLNTIRHLTRVEGLNSNQQVRALLVSGQRERDFPSVLSEEEQEALKDIHLVPLDQLERALDQAAVLQKETVRLEEALAETGRERDRALIALDEANRQAAALREARGQLQGMLTGMGLTGAGLLIMIMVVLMTLTGA
jgi:DNA-binding transcriptional MerR regulator